MVAALVAAEAAVVFVKKKNRPELLVALVYFFSFYLSRRNICMRAVASSARVAVA